MVKKYFNLVLMFVALVSFAACNMPKTEESNENAVDVPSVATIQEMEAQELEQKKIGGLFREVKIVSDKPAIAPGETAILTLVATLNDGSQSKVSGGWGCAAGSVNPGFGPETVFTCPKDVKDIEEIQVWVGGGDLGSQSGNILMKIKK